MAVHPGNLEAIRTLGAAESKKYLVAIGNLREHAAGNTLLEIARRNHEEFEALVGSAGSSIPGPGTRGELQRELSLDLNRRFLNFLSSLRQFLDHTETRLKRQYKGVPAVAAAFKARTSQAYDTTFAYRFFYRLRNFGQHLGMPIGFVDIESRALKRLSGIVLHEVHLMFDRDQLLAGGESVWTKGPLLHELAKMPPRFPVESYARTVMTQLAGIWDEVRAAERPILGQYADQIMTLTEPAHHAKLTPAVVRPFRRAGETHFEFHLPPIDVMSWLGYTVFKEVL